MKLKTKNQQGFTLVEMSIVLVIVGLVLMALLPAMNSLAKANQTTATQRNLDSLMTATAAFVQSRGCLPCPTPPSVSGSGLGIVRGDTSATPAACGTCSITEGVAPFISLGIPQSMAKDGYGHFITMRVDAALTVNFGVVPPASACQSGDTNPPCSATDITNATRKKGLCQAGLSAATRINVTNSSGSTQQAAVLFISHGANGRGAFMSVPYNGQRTPFPASIPSCSSSSGFERCNADGDLNYVNQNQAGGSSDPFDDLLVFMDRNAIVSYLGSVSCQTAW